MAADNSSLRRSVYGFLIVVAVAMAAARILAAARVYEPALHRDDKNADDRRPVWPAKRPRPMPTFSSNDRSRWATVRTLVDEGTYVVGERDLRTVTLSAFVPLSANNPFEAASLSQAAFLARSGSKKGIVFEDGWQTIDLVLHPETLKFYSSKPPLLSTLMAGLYWLLQLLTGWTLAERPAEVVRTLVLLVHVIPFAFYLGALGRLVERHGKTDWGRLFVFVAGCFATLLTPFLITFNNHTLGTFSVLFALVSMLTIWQSVPRQRTWPHFVLAGFFSAFAVVNELPALSFAVAVFVLLLVRWPVRTLLLFVPPAAALAAGFFVTNYLAVGQWRPAYSEFGSPWYEYEGSHWRKPAEGQVRHGIDFARYHESRATYAFHLLFGHHGFFALTPLWLLAFVGMIVEWRAAPSDRRMPRIVPLLALFISIVVIGFYLEKSDNYGGWTVGPRWLIWLTPLLLLTLLPAADWLGQRRWGRALALVCLAISVVSAHYPGWNPWRHPWTYDLMEWRGWGGY